VSDTPPSPLGRGRLAALVAGCLLLTALFTVALFPYAELRPRLHRWLTSATGAQVQIGSVSGGLGITGPALRARDLRLQWPGRPDLRLKRLRLRAAWSLSWLQGQPAIYVAARNEVGRLQGTLWPERVAFDGALEVPEATRLSEVWPALDFASGALQADLELAHAARGPLPVAGRLLLQGQAGSLSIPGLPLPAIPYKRLEARVTIAQSGWWQVEALDVEGPLLAFSARGRIAPLGGVASGETLDLQVDLQHLDPSLQPAAASLGIPAAGGVFHLGGSLVRPQLR